MKTARLQAVGDIHVADEPTPVPGADETLIRVSAVGVCGSDLHWFANAGIGDATLQSPLILGHEAAGITKAGQRVAVDPAISCGHCEYCLRGDPNLCSNLRFAGHDTQDGTLREMLAWPTRCLIPLPTTFSAEDGAMLEPLGVALHAVDLGNIRAGMRVGVFGCGPIGLLVLQLVRASGATGVYYTEPVAHRSDAASRMGGTKWTPDVGVDVAFECAGVNQAVEDAVAAAKPGGYVILIGIPDDDKTTFTASVARRKGLTIRLSRRMKHSYPRAIRLVESGMIDVRSLVTHRFPLERAAEAFAVAQRREGLKVMIEPKQEES